MKYRPLGTMFFLAATTASSTYRKISSIARTTVRTRIGVGCFASALEVAVYPRARARGNRTRFSAAAYSRLRPSSLADRPRIRPAYGDRARGSARSVSGGAGNGVGDENGSDDGGDGFDYDYLVIGAGSGGLASARRAATYGARVAVVEMGRLGGTCVNVGCVPKKVMWNAASIAETLHDMKHYGFTGYDSDAISFDWSFIKNNRDKYIQRLNSIYERNLANSGISSLLGSASFTTQPHQITITPPSNNPPTNVTARHILIATGGRPTFPLGHGIHEHAISSDGFFDLDELPRRAVVVGAGYIAVELAGVLQALGTDTSLVVREGKALRNFDDMLSDTLDEEMRRQGIQIFRDTNGVERIEPDGGVEGDDGAEPTKTVTLRNGEVIEGVDTVLVATGRSPNVEPLDLAAAGVRQEEGTGYVVVDDLSNTDADGVYALGDVCGKVELTPMAIAAGRRLADRLFGGKEMEGVKISYENVPTVVFTHPPIGTIGLTEREAVETYGEDTIKVYRSKFANLYYGPWQVEADDKPKTGMKLICAGTNELVVGLHVIGMGADEMLQGFGIAMKMGATKADFDACVAIHPTASEEFVTMHPWGLSNQSTGAKVSPLNGASTAQPTL